MNNIKWLLLTFFTAFSLLTTAQSKVDSLKFFTDEAVIDMTLTTDIKKMQSEKGEEVYQDLAQKLVPVINQCLGQTPENSFPAHKYNPFNGPWVNFSH